MHFVDFDSRSGGGGDGGRGEPATSDHWETMKRRLGTDLSDSGKWPVEFGSDCMASSQLPSHSDVHVSVLTAQRIKVSTGAKAKNVQVKKTHSYQYASGSKHGGSLSLFDPVIGQV
jgi:hypothetical protein